MTDNEIPSNPNRNTRPPHGHDLVDHLFPLQPPATPQVAETMDRIRAEFTQLANLVVALTPSGPDQTVAIRKLHEAQMAAIGNVACNQDGPKDPKA